MITKASIYKVQDINLNNIQDDLKKFEFTNCRPEQIMSSGWVSPWGNDEDFLYDVLNQNVVCLKYCVEEKIIPGPAVNIKLNKKVCEIEFKEERKVSRKERSELRESVIEEILPTALTKMYYVRVCITYTEHNGIWLIVDTDSEPKASLALAALRKSIGSLPAEPISQSFDPCELTKWVNNGEAPGQWQFNEYAVFKDAFDNGTVKFESRPDDDYIEYLKENDGFIKELSIIKPGIGSFKLNQDMVIKKFIADDVLESQIYDTEDEFAKLQAELILYNSTLINEFIELVKLCENQTF